MRYVVGAAFLISCISHGIQPPFLQKSSAHAEQLLHLMTLREKIGQLFMVPVTSIFYEPNDPLAPTQYDCPYNLDPAYIKTLIRDYHVGGLIFLFKSEPELQRTALHMYQQEAKIPLLIGQDLEWGLSQSLDHDPSKVTRYPHFMTLGALAPVHEHLIYQLGYEIGMQCTQIGVHLIFAPVADVNNNPKNPVIHDRSFGDNAATVARRAALYARGLQDAGVIACTKHFPGHGDVEVDSHEELPALMHTRDRLNAIELPPFKTLINAGIGAVMTAHLYIPAYDATPHRSSSMSYAVVTQLLKDELHFQGLAITDGLGMKAITKYYKPGELELEEFLAGNDILLCPVDVPRAVELIEHAIKTGRIAEADLDRRVLKILHAKEWASAQQCKNIAHDPLAYLVRPKARALQEELYRKTITIVRNTLKDPFTEALLKRSCILHIGGSTQHQFKNVGIYHQVSAGMQEDEKTHCLTAAQQTDTVIILMQGMNKFAQKDFGIAPNTRTLIQQLKAQHKKIIVVLFGSPYSVEYVKDADAIILAYAYKDTPALWQGVYDVLCGTLKAEGILPVNL